METVVAAGLAGATAMELASNGDLWVLEQTGAVKRFRPGNTAADIVADISTLGLNWIHERGLLGIAFDPQYASNRYVYLYYTATTPILHNRVSRFTVIDADAADYYFQGASAAASDAGSTGAPTQTIILELDPLGATNHNGGAIHFGPDGKLYVAVGENAVPSNAQTLANLHGKILRLNSDGSIPSDNPFFDQASGDERAIWALGLRNPFTFAFQPGTGRMFINDVGQVSWEEINDGIAGSNYGWPSVEGNVGTPPAGPGVYRPPIYTYPRGTGPFEGFAITGGAFYNPALARFPAQYVGDYFFADFGGDWINVLDVDTGGVDPFATGVSSPVDLKVSPDGGLYYLARGTGQAFRVDFPAGNNPPMAADDAFTTVENVPLTVLAPGVLGNDFDPEGGPLTALLAAAPSQAVSFALHTDGSFEYVPARGFSGRDSFAYQVSDGLALSEAATVQITVVDRNPWHNGLVQLDVSGDGEVESIDALLIFNYLNEFGPGPVPVDAASGPPFLDTSDDFFVSPLDALLVVNELNARSRTPDAEGEDDGRQGGETGVDWPEHDDLAPPWLPVCGFAASWSSAPRMPPLFIHPGSSKAIRTPGA